MKPPGNCVTLEPTLAGIFAFQDLPADVVENLNRNCQWRTLAPETIVIDYREPSTDVFFIVRGHVRAAIMSVAGKTIAFRELGPGEMFGELAAIDGKPRSASIETLETCVIAQMKAQLFSEVIKAEPDVMHAVMCHLAMHVRSLSERYYELSALGVCSRLHSELLRLALDGKVFGNSANIARLPTHTELASRIGTHREAVTRELNKLEREKVIVRDGSAAHINLNAMYALVHAAKGDAES